jgi:hypothetical protein
MSAGLSGVRSDRKFSYRKLEKLANGVRKALDYPADRAIDPLQLFESLDRIEIAASDGTQIPMSGGVVCLEGSEGYTRYDRQRHLVEILASELTYHWLETKHPRAAYFVAHELGHCVLHTDQLIRLAQMPTRLQAAFHRGRTDHEAYEDTEWQANAFASALLMPAKGIESLEQEHGSITVSLVAMQFCVSLEAAGYRLDLYEKRRSQLLA